MIVQCRSCTMRYHLDDSVLGSKGCQVRCTSCGHIWHLSPPVSKNMLIARPEETASPGQSFSRTTKVLISCVSLAIMGLGSFYLGRKSLGSLGPWIDGCVELWGKVEKKPALEITSFSFQGTDEGQFVCQGSIRNISNQTVLSPKILVLLNESVAQSKTTLHKKEHVLKDVQMIPGQSHSFSLSLPQSNCSSVTAMIPLE